MLMEANNAGRRINSFSPSCCSAFLWIQLLRCLFSHFCHFSHTPWMGFLTSVGWVMHLAQIVINSGFIPDFSTCLSKIPPLQCLGFLLAQVTLIFGKPFELRAWKGWWRAGCCYCCLYYKKMSINHLSGIVKQVSLAPELREWTEKNFLLWHFPLVLMTLNSCFRSCLH